MVYMNTFTLYQFDFKLEVSIIYIIINKVNEYKWQKIQD